MSPITYAHHFEPRLRPFLQTSLWEERGDAPVSLLSALARLDLDPWQEAAALSRLPRELAARQLGDLLKRMANRPLAAEFDADCQRAVELLPNLDPAPPGGPAPGAHLPGQVFLMDAVLVACFLTTLLLMSTFAARTTAVGAHDAAGAAAVAAPAAGRSRQR